MSWTITAAYGHCIEGMQRAEEAMKVARAKRDYVEYAALVKEWDDWRDLALVTPKFLEQAA